GDSWPDLWLPGSAGQDTLYQMHWYKGPFWQRFAINPGNFGPGAWCDLDGDGDLDLAVERTSGTPTVVWLENTGDPTLPDWPEHSIQTGLPGTPTEILADDLNRDGRIDLFVLCADLEACSLLAPTNPADPWTLVGLGLAPGSRSGLATGDIDRDGDPDLLWGNGWLENPGDLLVTPWPDHTLAVDWPTENRALLQDLNRDGRLDAVLGSSAGIQGVTWFAAPPDPKGGSWTPTPVGGTDFSGIAGLQTGDFDADGDVDIFACEDRAGEDPDKIVIFENSGGTGSVWLEIPGPATGSHRAKVADLDGDGDLDIAGKNHDGAGGALKLELWTNDLDPKLELDQWQRHVIDPARPWRAVFIDIADIDRDGFEDVVNGAWWYRNPGVPGGSWGRFDLGLPLRNMAAVSDFDRDGDFDILGTQGIPWDHNSQFTWARNDGSGNFTVLENIPDGSGSFLQGTTTAVFNVDRNLTFNPGEVALSWENGGGGIQMLTIPEDPSAGPWSWRIISPTTQFEGIHQGDIDRDGDRDLLLGNIWLRNDNPDWTTFTIENTTEEPDRVLLVDLSRDGRLDALVGFEEWPDELVWYEQPADPTGPWPRHDIATLYGPMSIDVADLDKDGDLDIVVGEHNLPDPGASSAFVYENISDGIIWQPHLIHTGDEHHMGTQLLDADNDGDLDIASFGWDHAEVVLYENLATPGGAGQPLSPAVTMDPPGGQFSCPVEVALGTEGAAGIRFTLDGSAPTESSPLYTVPVPMDTLTVLRARAFASGFQPGPVAEGLYSFLPDPIPPRLYHVESAGVPDRLIVQFTEPVDSLTVADAANYLLGPAGEVLQAVPGTDPTVVELTVSGLTEGSDYSLATAGILDLACPPNDMAPDQLAYFKYLPWIRTNEGVVALYEFDEGEGSVVHDRSGVEPPLDLTIADSNSVVWSDGRLDVVAETIIQSAGAAGKINSDCRSAGEITIETWLTFTDLSLNGPARIVTVSGDQYTRNFTLGQGVYGQAGDQIDARLTLSTTSTNGQPSLASGAGTLAADLTHVAYTRDSGGTARIFIDGQLVNETLLEGVMSNWVTTYPLALANEVGSPGGRFWLGGFHLVAVYDRALSPEVVFRNYSAGAPVSAVSPAGPPAAIPFALHHNVPNPFNPLTRITFDLAAPQSVDLAVFDVAGRLVRQLLIDAPHTAGRHSRMWDGRDNLGRTVSAGVYFYRIAAGPHLATKKMLLLK
ncbi:MAG: FG-GAP-like repeat-containing protein, partial [Candidatus Krumholzibacteriota bacterium]